MFDRLKNRKPGFNAAKKEGEVGFQPAEPEHPKVPTSAPDFRFPDGTPVTKENRGFEGGEWEAQHVKMEVAKSKQAKLEDGLVALRTFRDTQQSDDSWDFIRAGAILLANCNDNEDIDDFIVRLEGYEKKIATEIGGEAKLQARVKVRNDARAAQRAVESALAHSGESVGLLHEDDEEIIKTTTSAQRKRNLDAGVISLRVFLKTIGDTSGVHSVAGQKLMDLKDDNESIEDFIATVQRYEKEGNGPSQDSIDKARAALLRPGLGNSQDLSEQEDYGNQ